MASRSVLHVDVVRSAGACTVSLEGELDASTAGQVAWWSTPLSQWTSDVTVELAAVTFIDQAGLQALVDLRADLARHGHQLVIVGASDEIRRVLELSGLRAVLGDSGS